MSGDCGCEGGGGEGVEGNMGVFLHREALVRVGSDRRGQWPAAADCRSSWQRNLRSDHPLLVESLKVTDDLGNHPDELAGNVRDILLRQLPLLLAPAGRSAERRLELWHSKLRPEILRRIAQTKLTQAGAALHGSVLQLRLALQHSDNLWHDGQYLPHHFVHILLAEQARRLAVGGISDCRVRGLCLSQYLRQGPHQLPAPPRP